MSYITQDQFNPHVDFADIPLQTRKKGNQSTSQKYYYKDVVAAFDIETTYIEEIDNSVMYIWQMQIGMDITIIGRTWYEFKRLVEKLENELSDNERLVIFCHNLSFEFVYLSGIFDFNKEDIFALDHRKVLKALLHDKLEFRCSYLQTNMSLRVFCEKMGVKSFKLKMNYKKRRYWYTNLTDKEIAYCLNDVRGLVEAIYKEMERDGDNLYTLPLTSTGYARRDAKWAMKNVSHTYLENLLPDYDLYQMLREAFRGGNTHASRFYANKWLHTDVKTKDLKISMYDIYTGILGYSRDIASSYPTEIYLGDFPVSKFQFRQDATVEDLEDLIYNKKRACIIRCSLKNLKLKDDTIPVPYLPRSKCDGILNGVYDNGRIIKAEYIDRFTMTDIDYKILKKQYDFEISISKLGSARYGKLPMPLRKNVLKYYENKTTLKNKGDDEEHTAEFYEILYNKMKALLNAQFGMMSQDPVKIPVLYNNDREHVWLEDETVDPEELLYKYNRKAFLVYQWGVWVTSRAREKLQRGIDNCGLQFLYCDTDSCKYLGEVDWDDLNNDLIKEAKRVKAYADDSDGVRHYMGIWEKDGAFSEFETRGSKKYAYRVSGGKNDKKLKITIAGVNKKIGAIELERAGGIPAMVDGFKFIHAGGLEARYQDFPDIHEWINEDGVPIQITRNVSLVPNTKTLGTTAEYKALLEKYKSFTIDL